MVELGGSSPGRIDGERVTEHLAALVRVPSENPPGNEAEVAEVAAGLCDDAGLEVELHEVVPGRPSVVATWTGAPGPTVTYCSHIDVVPAGDPGLWAADPYGAEIRSGYMLGRGTSDAKGPCAAAIEAVAALRASGFEPHGTLQLALVADEEAMGFKGAGHLMETGVMTPDVGVVGEPTALRVVRAQRGGFWFRLIVRGVAGHGSAPERGVNAIRHMAAVIPRLEETLPDVSHPLLGGPTISVGTIRGGEKVNVIPAACIAEVDRRTVPGETDESVLATIQEAIEKASEGFEEIDATIEVAFNGKPFEIPEEAEVVQAALLAASEVLGREAEVIGFRGASDARFIAESGADVIVLGPGDITLAHTARESIEIAELARGAAVYAGLFARLLGPT